MNRPQNNLVMMVKTPKIGHVKTRLAKDIGPLAATQFYRFTAHRQIARLSQDPRWKTFIAIAPDASQNHWPWPKTAQKEPQGSGNLGDRMQRVFHRHAPNPTLIIGTDVPAITPWHINQAFQSLGHSSVVMGPCEDGGYWCIGQKNSPKTYTLFNNVRWSSAHTLQDTLNNIPNQNYHLTSPLEDIDDGQDYSHYQINQQGRWV